MGINENNILGNGITLNKDYNFIFVGNNNINNVGVPYADNNINVGVPYADYMALMKMYGDLQQRYFDLQLRFIEVKHKELTDEAIKMRLEMNKKAMLETE